MKNLLMLRFCCAAIAGGSVTAIIALIAGGRMQAWEQFTWAAVPLLLSYVIVKLARTARNWRTACELSSSGHEKPGPR